MTAPVQILVLGFGLLATLAVLLAAMTAALDEPRLRIEAHGSQARPTTAGAGRRWPSPLRWLLAALALFALLAIDRAAMAEAEAALRRLFPHRAPGGGPSFAVLASGLLLSAGGLWALRTGARSIAAAPLLALLAAMLCFTAAVDLALASSELSPDVIEPALRLVGLLALTAAVTGTVLSPGAPLRAAAVATGLYAAAFSARAISGHIVLLLWPHLFDATRTLLMFVVILLFNTMLAVLLLAAPIATADVATIRRARRLPPAGNSPAAPSGLAG